MSLPDCLREKAEIRWMQLQETYPDDLAMWSQDDAAFLYRTLALSDFIADAIIQDATMLPWLLAHLSFTARHSTYLERLKALLATVQDENTIMKLLRQFRRKEMVWLAWHDFNQELTVEEGLTHLSALAEAMILATYDWLYAQCCQEWGTPCDSTGKKQPMLILGMGKLGGEELNFSSDIDLIFTYPENGETQGGRRPLANAQFFTRLGQRLIKLLDQPTFDGFCYRVDMRLRPFGESGPLVMSFSALEDYYQEQGRDWERYAMIKARVMGKDQFDSYQALRQLLRPFVFRRYIDFSAIQSLRRMKAMIQREVRRQGVEGNIKLGAGGIREIEFVVQSFQLIRGGREPTLRYRQLLPTLDAIAELSLMPQEDVDTLKQAYLFLRRVENLLQAIDDKQTQTLPIEPLDQARLATALSFNSWHALHEHIQSTMAVVHRTFNITIGEEDEDQECMPQVYHEIWDHAREPSLTTQYISEVTASCPAEAANALFEFKRELGKRTLGSRGREVLNRLMPKMLLHIISHEKTIQNRVYHLLLRIVTRTTYLELLDEHPVAVSQLMRLCQASPLVAEQLAMYPILLDELLDTHQLYQPLSFKQYRQELMEFLARTPEEDMEQQMEMIRQFKQTQLLRIAAADIAGVLPLMAVSDHLTYLAEAIVEAVVNQAWYQMVAKFGQPTHLLEREGRGFAVVGYGKVGGIELAYGSDLDVVFLHDCPEGVETDGIKSIDGRQFYLRLAQRIVHLFSTRTATGILYEMDTRLRPSGMSGMLAMSLEGFADYQAHQAWTWEHQALVRARLIYGDTIIHQGFTRVRADVLTQKRRKKELQHAVVEMRNKMRSHLDEKNPDIFHLKQGKGGITDIEFLTQFWVLLFSHETPELTRWSDNIRIIEQLAELNLVPADQAKNLIDAYVSMRDKTHRLNLKEKGMEVDTQRFAIEREKVQVVWKQWFERIE